MHFTVGVDDPVYRKSIRNNHKLGKGRFRHAAPALGVGLAD